MIGLGRIITHDSVPNDNWNCADWKRWLQVLIPVLGKEEAVARWSSAWNDQGFFDKEFNFCKYDSDFVNYLLSQGIDIRSFLSALFTSSNEVIEDALDVTKNISEAANTVSEGVSKASDGVSNTLGVAKVVLPVVLGGVALFAGVTLYQAATGKKQLGIGPLKL